MTLIICYYLKIFTAKLWSWWIKQGLIGLQMFFSFMMMPNKNVRVFSFLSFQSEHRWGGDRCGRHREQTRQGTWDHSSNAFGHMHWLLILTHHANLMFIYLRTYWSFLKCKEMKNMTECDYQICKGTDSCRTENVKSLLRLWQLSEDQKRDGLGIAVCLGFSA